MNPNTGAIATFENEADAAAAGYNVPIPEGERAGLLAMNRAQRRAWARAQGLAPTAGSLDNLRAAAKAGGGR